MKLKIAHVCPYYTPAIGGVKQVVEELAKRQVKDENEVHIFTSDWDKNQRVEILDENIDGVNVHRCHHYLKIGDFSTVWPDVYKKLLNLKPNIIHAHVTGHLHAYLAMKAAKKLRVPFVVTTHCPWESKRSLPATIANWVSYKFFPVLRHADSIIAITEWERKFLLKEGVNPKNIYTIPNGMSAEFFKKVKPNNFKKKHNIPEKHKIVLFFGRLNYTKNPLMFLDIAKSILNKRNNVTFIICGPDEGQLKFVKERINSFPDNIKKSIRLLPPTKDRKEVAEMYQASYILVMPSTREGNPLVLYEGYANGLPVVASNVNGVPYGLKDEVNGFLLEHNDLKGFIKKTNLLLDDEELRNKMADNNKVKAKDFDWDIINNKTMKIYEKEIIIGLF